MVVQEHIPSRLRARPTQAPDQSDPKATAHLWVIMTRQGQAYEFMGGLRLERWGAWVSNSHAAEGQAIISALAAGDLPPSLLADLSKAGREIGLNQFGADVVEGAHDGRFYILELNDGMGLSGTNLERQKVAESYVRSFQKRLQAHEALLRPSEAKAHP